MIRQTASSTVTLY